MDSKRAQSYIDEIDLIMTGKSSGRMCLFYLDAISEAASEDEHLDEYDLIRIRVQVTAVRKMLENFNPFAKRHLRKEDAAI